MLDCWQLLRRDTKIRFLCGTLKTLLGFMAVVVASEYVSKALAVGITGSWMIYYGEAMSLFTLGSITLREGARALMALGQITKVFEAQAPQLLEAEPLA